MNIPTLSVPEVKKLQESEDVVFVDVRDPGSYESAHIPGAVHVNDHNVQSFVDSADRSRTIVVYCYHGNSSKGATAYFQEQGFSSVFSMDGGFAAWE